MDWPPERRWLRNLDEVAEWIGRINRGETTVGSLASRRAAIDRQVARLLEHAAQLERFPDRDPYEDGQVLRFTRILGGTRYSYAAIRAGGRYWVTGTDKASRSWMQFVEWLVEAGEIASFEELEPKQSDAEPPAEERVDVLPPRDDRDPCGRRLRAEDHKPHSWRYENEETVRQCVGWPAQVPPFVRELAEKAGVDIDEVVVRDVTGA